MTNRLGEFYFIKFDPPPQGPAQVVALESSPGVDGHSYWTLGEKGEPQQVRTIVDCATQAAAMILFRDYQNAIGQTLPAQWGDTPEVTEWRFVVLAVRQIDIVPLILSVGGVIGGSGTGRALLVAEWVIVPELQVAEAEA